MKDKKGRRYEDCNKCGKDWNVSVNAKIPKSGYLCPRCRQKRAVKAVMYIGLIVLGIITCKIGVEQAMVERGRFAVGGEWLLIGFFSGIAYMIEECYSIFKSYETEAKAVKSVE